MVLRVILKILNFIHANFPTFQHKSLYILCHLLFTWGKKRFLANSEVESIISKRKMRLEMYAEGIKFHAVLYSYPINILRIDMA